MKDFLNVAEFFCVWSRRIAHFEYFFALWKFLYVEFRIFFCAVRNHIRYNGMSYFFKPQYPFQLNVIKLRSPKNSPNFWKLNIYSPQFCIWSTLLNWNQYRTRFHIKLYRKSLKSYFSDVCQLHIHFGLGAIEFKKLIAYLLTKCYLIRNL